MEDNKFISGVITGIVSTLAVVALGTIVFILISGTSVTGGFASGNTDTTKTVQESEDEIISKIEYLTTLIDQNSIYEIDDQSIIDGIYKGIFDSFNDNYSQYYTAKEFAAFSEETSGNYCGIGAYIGQKKDDGSIYISSPMKGTPAEKAGLRAGDVIVAVDDKEITNETSDTVVSWIKGDEGTKVKLKIYREGEKDFLTIEAERKKIEVPTVSTKVLEDGIGYISVSQFDTVTAAQFKDAIKEMNDKVDGVVIDLRSNPGGNLNTVVEMADMLLPKGKKIVYTKDKNDKLIDSYISKNDAITDLKLTLLIDGYSASASEIFAGVVKDYKLGKIVGTKSFGKGIVQSVYKLPDNSAVKLTTAKYYTPNGNYIHEVGIEPDIKVEFDADKYYNDKVDVQLDKAVAALKSEINNK